jgi:hypothetical protein
MRASTTTFLTIAIAAVMGACGPTAPPGTGGTGGTAGVGGTGGGSTRPPCQARASQTVIVGDSFINWFSHTLPADLAREAGETWRLYAVGGSSMASGGITGFIPDSSRPRSAPTQTSTRF